MKNNLLVCNIDLHNTFGSNSSLFFDRIKHLEQMRTAESDESFSFFITSEYEYNQLKQLQLGIKTGKIDFIDYGGGKTSRYIFALDINQRIVKWLYNISTSTLEKQLIAWMACMHFFNPEKQEILDRQFHQRLLGKAKKLIREIFPKYFKIILNDRGEYQRDGNVLITKGDVDRKYSAICVDYYGSPPCYPLNNPIGYPRGRDEFGIIGTKLNFTYSFMYDRDWKTIVQSGIRDNLQRAESTPNLIQDWKKVITKHEIHANHIYNHINGSVLEDYRAHTEGLIYLLSNEAFTKGMYKIGYTTRAIEDRVNELYTTGVPCPFDVEFVLNVNNLKKVETAIHSQLKQYRFNEDREFFVGTKDLFIKTICEHQNLR